MESDKDAMHISSHFQTYAYRKFSNKRTSPNKGTL